MLPSRIIVAASILGIATAEKWLLTPGMQPLQMGKLATGFPSGISKEDCGPDPCLIGTVYEDPGTFTIFFLLPSILIFVAFSAVLSNPQAIPSPWFNYGVGLCSTPWPTWKLVRVSGTSFPLLLHRRTRRTSCFLPLLPFFEKKTLFFLKKTPQPFAPITLTLRACRGEAVLRCWDRYSWSWRPAIWRIGQRRKSGR